MRIVRGFTALAFVNIAANPIAEGLCVIDACFDQGIFAAVVSRERRLKARRTDSESQFLAIKKFSCPPASRLIGTRQNPFCGRIATADSQTDSSP
jgi:hypothetical protein